MERGLFQAEGTENIRPLCRAALAVSGTSESPPGTRATARRAGGEVLEEEEPAGRVSPGKDFGP